MEKNFTIKEVSSMLNININTIRSMEEALGLHIKRNTKNIRLYLPKDIELLKKIKELKESGMSYGLIKNNLSQMLDEPSKDNGEAELNNDAANETAAASLIDVEEEKVIENKVIEVTALEPKDTDSALLDGNSLKQLNIEIIRAFAKDLMKESIRDAMAVELTKLNLHLCKMDLNLELMNKNVDKQLELQEKHFAALDAKLTNWRIIHSQHPKKKSFLKKLFRI